MSPRFWLYRFKYRYARELNLTKPVDVSLELAAKCNQACSYCYWGDAANVPFKPGMMSWDLIEKCIFDAANLGANSIKYNFRGESTLNPHFGAATRLSKALAHGSVFLDRLTNSNFKFKTSRDDIFEGLANQTKVKVSFDSFDPKVMKKQRAGSNPALALENIDKFYNWPKRKTELVIQAVRTQLNKDEDIAAEVKKRWPGATCNINNMVSGRLEKDLSDLEVMKREFSNRKPCVQANARLIVRWDGGVQSCCPSIKDEITLGDANTHSLIEIWNGEPAKQLRQSLRDKSAFAKDPCKTCPSFESYGNFKPKWSS